jgi:hypothetical protein
VAAGVVHSSGPQPDATLAMRPGSDSLPRRFEMTDANGAGTYLQRAKGTAEILDAAYSAFEEMLSMADGYHEGGAPLFPGLVMAAAAAADGRDALLDAPSLPLHAIRRCSRAPSSSEDVASELATLSKSVTERLTECAACAVADGDRAACRSGARHAGEVHALVTGLWP